MTWEEADKKWAEDAAENDWRVSHIKAAWPWRLPGVRFVRYMWHAWRASEAAHRWASAGLGFGGVAPYDRWVLYAIRRGWA